MAWWMLDRWASRESKFNYFCSTCIHLLNCSAAFDWFRPGWFTTTNFINTEWAKHQIPVDHWRSLQLPAVSQQYLNAGAVQHVNTTCNGCVEHVFYPPLCDPANGGNAAYCILLIAGEKGESCKFISNSYKPVHASPVSLHLGTISTISTEKLMCK